MLQLDTSTLYVHKGETTRNQKIAAFDLDWTITRPIHSRFFRDAFDFAFLPNRISTLKKLKDLGYVLVIFTNQGYKGNKLTTALERVNNIIEALQKEEINPWVLAAIGDDKYRKPNKGMWDMFISLYPESNCHFSEEWFVGDSAGRPQDHSNFDLEFAKNIGIKFYTPEEIFPKNIVNITEEQTIFLFVGMPGSGKSTFYKEYLKSKGIVHANQDTLKTRAKVLKTVKDSLIAGRSVAIDATNPIAEKRKEFIFLGCQYQVPTIILYFTDNGYNINKLREKPVPDIVYNKYFKILEEPSYELDHVQVIEI